MSMTHIGNSINWAMNLKIYNFFEISRAILQIRGYYLILRGFCRS